PKALAALREAYVQQRAGEGLFRSEAAAGLIVVLAESGRADEAAELLAAQPPDAVAMIPGSPGWAAAAVAGARGHSPGAGGHARELAAAAGGHQADKLARVAGSELGLPPPTVDPLTRREREIARMAGQGMTDRDIAAALVVSVRTVESHLASAYRKLGIRSR